MPTIVRQAGFRVMVHTSDHAPAHVHCYRGKRLIKVRLSDCLILFREHASDRDIKVALKIVRQHRGRLLKAWRTIHGEKK